MKLNKTLPLVSLSLLVFPVSAEAVSFSADLIAQSAIFWQLFEVSVFLGFAGAAMYQLAVSGNPQRAGKLIAAAIMSVGLLMIVSTISTGFAGMGGSTTVIIGFAVILLGFGAAKLMASLI